MISKVNIRQVAALLMDRHIENDPINYKKGYQVSLNEQEISKKGRYSSDMEENKDSTNANKTDEKANKE